MSSTKPILNDTVLTRGHLLLASSIGPDIPGADALQGGGLWGVWEVGANGTTDLVNLKRSVVIHVRREHFVPERFVVAGTLDSGHGINELSNVLSQSRWVMEPVGVNELPLRDGMVIRRTGRPMPAYQDASLPYDADLRVVQYLEGVHDFVFVPVGQPIDVEHALRGPNQRYMSPSYIRTVG